MNVCQKEKTLIMQLRKQGRYKISLLAKQHNVPTSTMADLLNRMERKNLVQHKSYLAFEQFGYPVKLIIALKTILQQKTSLKQYLEYCKNVNTLYAVNGDYDYVFEALFANNQQAQEFLDDLNEKNVITDQTVNYIVDTINHEAFMTKENHFE